MNRIDESFVPSSLGHVLYKFIQFSLLLQLLVLTHVLLENLEFEVEWFSRIIEDLGLLTRDQT